MSSHLISLYRVHVKLHYFMTCVDVCTCQSTGQSFQWYEHVCTVNNTKVKKLIFYRQHLFMINFIFVNFYKMFYIITTFQVKENKSGKNEIFFFKCKAY